MRKLLFIGLTLGFAASAWAKPNMMNPAFQSVSNGTRDFNNQLFSRQLSTRNRVAAGTPGGSSLGAGMQYGNEPGHPDSPGGAKIDPESRGPINDIQAGRGTNDTRQSLHPKPVR